MHEKASAHAEAFLLSFKGGLLYLAIAIPVRTAVLRGPLESLDEDAPQAIAAIQIHGDELKADFIHPRAPQQHLPANLLDAQRDFDVGF